MPPPAWVSRTSGLLACAGWVVWAGCATQPAARRQAVAGSPPLDPSYQPRSLGRGTRYRPAPWGGLVGHAASVPVSGGTRLACSPAGGPRYGVHLELFAAGHVVAIPAGIGVAPPQRRQGAFVIGGRCSYPLRTLEPTGVIEVSPRSAPRLGDLFSIWGQPLTRRRVLAFGSSPRSRIRAYVDGLPWRGDPRRIPLSPHAQIVLEAGAYVPPHPSYRFPPGL